MTDANEENNVTHNMVLSYIFLKIWISVTWRWGEWPVIDVRTQKTILLQCFIHCTYSPEELIGYQLISSYRTKSYYPNFKTKWRTYSNKSHALSKSRISEALEYYRNNLGGEVPNFFFFFNLSLTYFLLLTN